MLKYSKAIAGLIMAMVAPLGITSLTSFEEGITVLVTGLLTGIAVYIVPNKG